MPHRILIVDDDQEFNGLLQDVYEQASFEVVSARDAEEGLDLFERHPFDIVLTDHRMPGRSGVELVQRIKDRRPDMPIVMVSGYLENHTIRELIRCGVGGVFMKPLNIFSLLKKTHELIDRHQSRRRNSAEAARTNTAPTLRAFPGPSPASVELLRRAQTLAAFSGKLILEGAPGCDFVSFVEDLCHLRGTKERFLCLDASELSPVNFRPRLRLPLKGDENLTLLLLQAERLPPALIPQLVGLLRLQDGLGQRLHSARLVFAFEETLGELCERKAVTEEYFLFLGPNQTRLPALESMREDIPALAQSYLRQENPELLLAPEALVWLKRRDWADNHRELHRLMRDGARLARQDALTADFLESLVDDANSSAEPSNQLPLVDVLTGYIASYQKTRSILLSRTC